MRSDRNSKSPEEMHISAYLFDRNLMIWAVKTWVVFLSNLGMQYRLEHMFLAIIAEMPRGMMLDVPWPTQECPWYHPEREFPTWKYGTSRHVVLGIFQFGEVFQIREYLYIYIYFNLIIFIYNYMIFHLLCFATFEELSGRCCKHAENWDMWTRTFVGLFPSLCRL